MKRRARCYGLIIENYDKKKVHDIIRNKREENIPCFKIFRRQRKN